MDLSSAGQLAKQLMDQHGLLAKGWSFGFNRRKRALGLCRYDAKRIELSSHFVAANGADQVRDTVLHEVAHALAGPEAGHGPKWQRMCVRVGAKPQRTCSQAAMPQGKYQALCPGCQAVHSKHRKPMAKRVYYCRHCGPDDGALVFRLQPAGGLLRR